MLDSWVGAGRERAAAWLAAIATSTSAGLIAALRPSSARIGILVAVVLLASVAAGPVVVATSMLASSFITSYTVVIAGFGFYAEHFLVVILAVVLLVHRPVRPVASVLGHPTVLALGVFIVYSGINSLLRAEDPTASLPIVGWLALSWLILVTLLLVFPAAADVESRMVMFAGLAALFAVCLYLLSHFDVTTIGTSVEPLTRELALSGLSLEANLLGSALAIWAFIGLTSRRFLVDRGYQAAVGVASIALVLTLTRAAIVGFAFALLIWMVAGGEKARRQTFYWATVIAVVVSVTFALVPSVLSPATVKFSPSQIVNLSSGTGASRVDNLKRAREDLGEFRWVTGLGTNSFGQRHQSPGPSPEPAYLPSLPAQIVYDTGVPGVLLLAIAFLGLKPFRRRSRARALGVTTIFLVSSLATSSFWFGTTWAIIGIAILGTTFGGSKSDSGKHSSGMSDRSLPRET